MNLPETETAIWHLTIAVTETLHNNRFFNVDSYIDEYQTNSLISTHRLSPSLTD